MDVIAAGNIIEGEIKAAGFTIKYRTSLSGCVWPKQKVCEIPQIKTRKSLYIAAHELSHVLGNNYGEGKPRYEVEFLAEQFAHNKMRELGFSVPKSMTARARQYVFAKVMKAQRRGLKKVNPTVKAWFK